MGHGSGMLPGNFPGPWMESAFAFIKSRWYFTDANKLEDEHSLATMILLFKKSGNSTSLRGVLRPRFVTPIC